MMEISVVAFMEQCVWWLAVALGPLLLAVAALGFCLSLLLAILQVQDSGLVLCARLLAVVAVLLVGGEGALQSLVQLCSRCLDARI